MRRSCLAVAMVAVLVPVAASAQTAAAQSAAPATTQQPTSTGRTPRVPREPSATDAPIPSAGASVGEAGATPPAPVDVAHTRVRSHVQTDQRVIALTLDDGYRPDPRILDLIAEYGLHGTAFLVGQVADSNPELLRRLVELGWMVCSHTYSHRQLTTADEATIRSEMTRGIEAVERVVGYRCPYFRAPFGSVDTRVAQIADELGVELIGWESSLSDSAPKGTDPNLQVEIAKRYVRPGSILLGHFGGTNSYRVLRSVLTWLRDEEYGIGSVDELIDGTVPEFQPTDVESADATTIRVESGSLFPAAADATRPLSLSVTEILVDVLGALALVLAWQLIPRRRARRRRAQPLRCRRKRPLHAFDYPSTDRQPAVKGSAEQP